jgi:transposase
MDNTAIHTGCEAQDLEQWFWELIVEGHPLHVLVIFLPTRSPELNPIELIFNIFLHRIRSYQIHRHDGPVDRAVIRYGDERYFVQNDTQLLHNFIRECQ